MELGEEEEESEPNKLNYEWEKMSERILIGKILLKKRELNPVIISVMQNIELIANYCQKSQNLQLEFDINWFKRFVDQIFSKFFASNQFIIINDMNFMSLFKNFKKFLGFVFDEKISIEKLKEFANKYNLRNLNRRESFFDQRKEIQKLVKEFFHISEKLPQIWIDAQLFSENQEKFQFFTNEIYFFCDEIKICARGNAFYLLPTDQFINSLKDSIRTKLDLFKDNQSFSRIFKEFIDQFYYREFFSKFDETQEEYVEYVEITEPVTTSTVVVVDDIILEETLANPSDLINDIRKSRKQEKQELSNLLCETYSIFIDQNFENVNQNLKDIIEDSIKRTLK